MAPTRSLLPLVLLTLVLLACPVHAQEEAEPWDVEVELGLNGASGNSSFTVLRAGFQATRTRADRYELDFSSVVRYGTNEDRVIANDARASVKFDWQPQGRVSPFVFVDASRDEIRRLDFQMDGGVGAKWTFARAERTAASLSLAALMDYQNFDVVSGSADPESEGLARWSFRFKAERTVQEGTSLEHVSFYQPVMNDFGDYAVEVTNTLSTKLMDNLTLAMEHLYLRDQVPPPGAARDDQRFSILFRLGL